MIKIDISAPLDAFLVLVLHHRLEDRGGGSEDHLVYGGKGKEKSLGYKKKMYKIEINLVTLHRLSVEDKGEVALLHFVEHILPNFPATLILSLS